MKKYLILAVVVAAAAYGAWAIFGAQPSVELQDEMNLQATGSPVGGSPDGGSADGTEEAFDAELDALGNELDAAGTDSDSELDSLEVEMQ